MPEFPQHTGDLYLIPDYFALPAYVVAYLFPTDVGKTDGIAEWTWYGMCDDGDFQRWERWAQEYPDMRLVRRGTPNDTP